MKRCKKCSLEKPFEAFFRSKASKDGYLNSCKACNKSSWKKFDTKEYHRKNKAARADYAKKYFQENKERLANTKYNIDPNLAEKRQEKYKAVQREKYANDEQYRDVRKEMSRNYLKNNQHKKRHKYKTDPNFRLRRVLSVRVTDAIKNQATTKAYKTIELIGCTVDEVRVYLENQFVEGMSWDNHGEWHIDHVIPCASFDLSDPVQQKKCFHYTNLQPLWAKDNLSKGDRILE